MGKRKNPAAIKLGRKGGLARARSLSRAELVRIARLGVAARLDKKGKGGSLNRKGEKMTTRRSHQDGYIFKRGKNFVIRYRVRTANGTWKHKAETIYSSHIKDARNFLGERLRSLNQGITLPPEVLFSDFVGNHWAKYTTERWKPSTRATLGSFVQRHLLPHFGSFNLAEIGPVQVQEFMDRKRSEGLSDKTRLHLWSLLERIFNVAIELDLLSVSPMRKRVCKPRPQNAEKPILTPEQVRKIVKALPVRYRSLATVIALTGVRLGEALALQWRDIDFASGTLHIRRSVWRGRVQTPKSGATIRTKHLVVVLAAVFREQQRNSYYTGPEDFVFANTRGTPLNPDDCRQALYDAMHIVGIKRGMKRAYGYHLLRHTAGSLMYTVTGGDLKQTQAYMGHSHVGVTADTYVHLDLDSQLAAARQLEQTLFPDQLLDLCSNCAQNLARVN